MPFESIIHIDAAAVQITPAPGFPNYMPGTIIIDEEVVPVVDTQIRFGLGEGVKAERACFVLTRLEQNSDFAEGDNKCAVLVEEVSGMFEPESSLGAPPAVNQDSFAMYVTGTYIQNDETYYIITPEKLCSAEK